MFKPGEIPLAFKLIAWVWSSGLAPQAVVRWMGPVRQDFYLAYYDRLCACIRSNDATPQACFSVGWPGMENLYVLYECIISLQR